MLVNFVGSRWHPRIPGLDGAYPGLTWASIRAILDNSEQFSTIPGEPLEFANIETRDAPGGAPWRASTALQPPLAWGGHRYRRYRWRFAANQQNLCESPHKRI